MESGGGARAGGGPYELNRRRVVVAISVGRSPAVDFSNDVIHGAMTHGTKHRTLVDLWRFTAVDGSVGKWRCERKELFL